MTDATDIKDLREAALKATTGEWRAFADDSSKTYAVHTPNDKRCENIIKWAGFDCQKNAKANVEFIAMANPSAIIALLDQIEAERQRADGLVLHVNTQANMREKAEAELAALKEDQVPMFEVEISGSHWLNMGPIACADLSKLPDGINKLFTAQQKPVVLPKKAVRNPQFNAGIEACRKAIEAAGGVVRDSQ